MLGPPTSLPGILWALLFVVMSVTGPTIATSLQIKRFIGVSSPAGHFAAPRWVSLIAPGTAVVILARTDAGRPSRRLLTTLVHCRAKRQDCIDALAKARYTQIEYAQLPGSKTLVETHFRHATIGKGVRFKLAGRSAWPAKTNQE